MQRRAFVRRFVRNIRETWLAAGELMFALGGELRAARLLLGAAQATDAAPAFAVHWHFRRLRRACWRRFCLYLGALFGHGEAQS